MSAAFTGPAQALGNGVKEGIQTYFSKINANGGVNGNTLKLVALDDGYEPKKCAPNMRKLITKENVFAVIGNVGTPTAIVAVPIANELKTPFFGAFTGSGVLRKTPPDRYIFNYRASYAEETAAMIKSLVNILKIKPEEIALFTQNDGYGDAGYKGAMKALKSIGYKKGASLAHGRYQRNTVNIEDGLLTILDAEIEPKAIIMVGAYKPCAAFIKLAKENELTEVLFLNVSFVGSKALAKELGKNVSNVIVTQVVPHYESDLPIIKEYKEDLKKFSKTEGGFVSLEGYLAAKAFVLGLEKSGKSPTKESFIDALEKMSSFDLGIGKSHYFSKKEHQISHEVWPTILKSEAFQPLDWKSLK
ncbi:MAG: ligand-binding receptor [Candidatus Cloacimonadota bacterium]|nr:MAG: ligand-binding receptor [Candidatus Cloacimonadota bacterium]